MTTRHMTLLLAAVLLTLAATAVGCGGSGETTVTVTDSTPATTADLPTAPDQSGTTGATGATGNPDATEPPGEPSVAGTGAVSTHVSSFQSPTGNIGCVIASGNTRCDIAEHTFNLPPRPSSCNLDWGQGLTFSGNSSARIVCAGDTAMNPAAATLGYGEVTRVGPVLCQSTQEGMSCANSASGHGFFLSRERYQIY